MSYDIFFVRRDPGQTFEDALDELEGSYENGDPGELTDNDLERWDALLPLAREILGDVVVDDADEETRELTATRTGVELTMIQGEIAIRVPDDRAPADDIELMAAVYELARVVEDVTGLEGYDPQTGSPVSDQEGGGAAAEGRQERTWDDDDDESQSDGTSTTLPAMRRIRTPSDTESDPSERRRWGFWKK
jgi:hypothetical protein